jgi:hypothetical protein
MGHSYARDNRARTRKRRLRQDKRLDASRRVIDQCSSVLEEMTRLHRVAYLGTVKTPFRTSLRIAFQPGNGLQTVHLPYPMRAVEAIEFLRAYHRTILSGEKS